MTIGENIRRVRTRHDLTQEEFGKVAGVSGMAVSQWENDRAVPRMGAVQAIADHFGISMGDIIDDAPSQAPQNALRPNPNARPAYLPLRGRGKVHAGEAQEPEILDECIPVPWEVAEHHPEAYFLLVEGNCMNRVYPEGCHVLVDPKKEPSNGSIAVVSIDGADYVMRRLYRTPRTIVLSPDSFDESYEDIVITSDSDHRVEFVGTVVWFQPAREME